MIDRRKSLPRTLAFSAGVLALFYLIGCGGSSVFIDPTFDFGYVERVAIVPFDNLSQQTQVLGKQATLAFTTELLSRKAFGIVEPGETAKVMADLNLTRPGGAPDMAQIQEMGKRLKVQGLIFGSVSQTSMVRSGLTNNPVITLDVRLVETESGATVWAASRSAGRPGFFSTLFGVGGKADSEVLRQCIDEVLGTLIK